MKTLIATAILALALAIPALGATGPARNVDDGGGAVPSGSYIARVYVNTGGYWHWVNCQFIVYPWGAFQDRCW